MKIRFSSIICAAAMLLPAARQTFAAPVLCVSQQAAGPVHDGKSWMTAFLTIPEAVAASGLDDEVWVAEGTYVGPQIQVSQELSLYGEFAGTESERSQRDPSRHPSVIQCSDPTLFAVFLGAGAGPASVVDGFTFTSNHDIAVFGSPTISHCVFRDGIDGIQTRGNLSSPRVLYNTVVNMSGYPIGFGFSAGSPLVQGNRIDACYYFGILYVTDVQGQGPSINGNVITNTYEAISVNQATCYIADNLVVGGEVTAGYYDTIVNNTIVCCNGHGLTINNAVQNGLIANNIVAFNSYGMSTNGGNPKVDPTALFNNCVYGNSIADYFALKPARGFQGNISVDPQFVNRIVEFHLAATSPLIDAGNDAYVQNGDTDVAGNPRIQSAHVDIGAYEFGGTSFTMGDVAGALRLWGGLSAATPDLSARLDVELGIGVDIRDAVRLARKVAGLEQNP